jgi:uncharacterized protein
MRCPICKQTVPDTVRELRPFCSKRCKLIDLGKWLDGSYAIPDETDSPSEENLVGAEPDEIVPRRR